jgi:acyl-CoA thioester hydrolase
VSSYKEAEVALLEQVLKLPRIAELEIPEDYLDGNRHVNMMYFTLIANLGWRTFFDELGLPREHFIDHRRSTFALRQFISYFNELKEEDRVAVHGGLVDYDSKRLHFIYYIVNLTTHKLASSDERLIMYIDMTTRRSATFDPQIMEQLEGIKRQHAASGWKPELSGAISVKKERPTQD